MQDVLARLVKELRIGKDKKEGESCLSSIPSLALLLPSFPYSPPPRLSVYS